jgi:hypothetical protein
MSITQRIRDTLPLLENPGHEPRSATMLRAITLLRDILDSMEVPATVEHGTPAGKLAQENEQLRIELAKLRSNGWAINRETYELERVYKAVRAGLDDLTANLRSVARDIELSNGSMYQTVWPLIKSIRAKSVTEPQTPEEEAHNNPAKMPPVREPLAELEGEDEDS